MISIRAAAPDEAEALARAHREADWQTYSVLFGAKAKRLDPDATLERWRDALRDGDIVLAALDSAAIVGVAHVRGEVLQALYLLASHQRQGLGRGLLTRALLEARARGAMTIRWNVVESNMRAIDFYEAHGARRVGRSLQRDADGDEWWDLDYEMPSQRP